MHQGLLTHIIHVQSKFVGLFITHRVQAQLVEYDPRQQSWTSKLSFPWPAGICVYSKDDSTLLYDKANNRIFVVWHVPAHSQIWLYDLDQNTIVLFNASQSLNIALPSYYSQKRNDIILAHGIIHFFNYRKGTHTQFNIEQQTFYSQHLPNWNLNRNENLIASPVLLGYLITFVGVSHGQMFEYQYGTGSQLWTSIRKDCDNQLAHALGNCFSIVDDDYIYFTNGEKHSDFDGKQNILMYHIHDKLLYESKVKMPAVNRFFSPAMQKISSLHREMLTYAYVRGECEILFCGEEGHVLITEGMAVYLLLLISQYLVMNILHGFVICREENIVKHLTMPPYKLL